jgi:hypothetical protein
MVSRIIVTAIQARMGVSAPLIAKSALRLIFYSADEKIPFVIDEHEFVVHIKLQQSSINVAYKT